MPQPRLRDITRTWTRTKPDRALPTATPVLHKNSKKSLSMETQACTRVNCVATVTCEVAKFSDSS